MMYIYTIYANINAIKKSCKTGFSCDVRIVSLLYLGSDQINLLNS